MRIKFWIIGLLLLLVGCASGFNREKMRSHFSLVEPTKYTDAEIKKLFKSKPQLKFPFTVAVAFRGGYGMQWTQKEKEELQALGEELRKEGIVEKIFTIPSLLTGRNTLRDYRIAAARYQADTLLVIQGTNARDSYANAFSLFYLTIVGMWIAPGSHRDSLTLIQGVLLDVRNEYIYASMEAEGEGTNWGPFATIEWKPALDEARNKAFKGFKKELKSRLRALKPKESDSK